MVYFTFNATLALVSWQIVSCRVIQCECNTQKYSINKNDIVSICSRPSGKLETLVDILQEVAKQILLRI